MIQKVYIKRFTVLKEFTHDFKGRHTLICGKNALGKSSILRFIQLAMGRQDCMPPGIDIEGEVVENINGQQYVFSVKMDKGKPKITITSPDGLSDSRRGVIAGITGAMDFNISEFIEMSKSDAGRKDQVKIFKKFFPKDIIDGIEKLEANVKSAYDDRTQLNKDIKTKDTEVNTNPLNHLLPKHLELIKFVDVSATMTELKTIQDANTKVQRVVDNKTTRATEIVAETKVIADLQAKLDAKIKLQADAEKWLETNTLQETTEKEEIIRNATKSNTDFANVGKLKKDKELLTKMVDESETATVNVESQREAIRSAIKDMTTDLVPGLIFDENGLIYNGLPVHPDTHSTSERIKLGVKIKIAQNKEIGVLFIESLESVDEDGMKAILEAADEMGMQVIGEEVRRNQKELVFEIIGE